MQSKCLETSWANSFQGMWSSRMWTTMINVQLVHVDAMIRVQVSSRRKMQKGCICICFLYTHKHSHWLNLFRPLQCFADILPLCAPHICKCRSAKPGCSAAVQLTSPHIRLKGNWCKVRRKGRSCKMSCPIPSRYPRSSQPFEKWSGSKHNKHKKLMQVYAIIPIMFAAYTLNARCILSESV